MKVILECNDLEIINFDIGIIPRIGETISVKIEKDTKKYKIKNVDYKFKDCGFSRGYVTDTIVLTAKEIKPLALA